MTDRTADYAHRVTDLEQSRLLATDIPGPRSKELAARKSAAVSSGVGVTMPVYCQRAFGGIVEDVDGNRLIDLGSGIAVTTIGNSSPLVVEAVREQVAEFTHTCFMVTPYEEYVTVAEHLNRLTPGTGQKRTALFNSGAEAVENAVKIARSYTKKTAVVAFDHAYHGRTNMTMALTAKSMPYKSGFGPFSPEIYRAPMSYPYRDGLIDKEMGTNGELAAERALSIIDKQIGAANLAALIIEPIQGEGGFIVPAPGFLPALLQWCRDNNVVFIADEVQGWIKLLTCNPTYTSCSAPPQDFDLQAGSTVVLAQGPGTDGGIYQLTYSPGTLVRISPAGSAPPAAGICKSWGASSPTDASPPSASRPSTRPVRAAG